ncbi:MAG TPA: hypothetical protein VK157_07100 [Phycisphaerales bacterium]|nr:hypothetical protein [Phycisphaerales bacterium]
MIRAVGCALIASLVWFCFDDRLASLVSNTEIGNLRWHHVFCACLFVSMLLNAAGGKSMDDLAEELRRLRQVVKRQQG